MITLYSTGCPNCNVLKSKLDSAGITYAINSNIKKMMALGFRSAPILDVNGEVMNYSKAVQWIAKQ